MSSFKFHPSSNCDHGSELKQIVISNFLCLIQDNLDQQVIKENINELWKVLNYYTNDKPRPKISAMTHAIIASFSFMYGLNELIKDNYISVPLAIDEYGMLERFRSHLRRSL